jgi:hypothetical protein
MSRACSVPKALLLRRLVVILAGVEIFKDDTFIANQTATKPCKTLASMTNSANPAIYQQVG